MWPKPLSAIRAVVTRKLRGTCLSVWGNSSLAHFLVFFFDLNPPNEHWPFMTHPNRGYLSSWFSGPNHVSCFPYAIGILLFVYSALWEFNGCWWCPEYVFIFICWRSVVGGLYSMCSLFNSWTDITDLTIVTDNHLERIFFSQNCFSYLERSKISSLRT